MRMHSSKCSPNLTVGVFAVFSLIVLYSYWNLSTYNRDLLLKLHSAEEQVIELDKNHGALQSTYEKLVGDKSKLEFSLMEEQVSERDIKKKLTEKDDYIKQLKSQLDNEQKDAQTLTEELRKVETMLESKDTETTELKSKITSLQTRLSAMKKEKEVLAHSLKDVGVGKPQASATKAEESLQPAFASDPNGAEQQMNPGPSSNNAKEDKDNGGEVGVGVLPIPGSNGDDAAVAGGKGGEGPAGENLDNAEDDIKAGPAENQKEEDDPADGALNEHGQKEAAAQGVGPAPPHGEDQAHQNGADDNREAAHLQPQDTRAL